MATKNKNGVSRREVLRYSAVGASMAALGPLGANMIRKASAGATSGKQIVIINMFGGNDGLNTVIPALSAPYGAYASRRPTIAIDPDTHYSFPNASDYPNGDPRSGKDVNDFMLGTDYLAHPALNRVAELYQEGSMAVVNNVGYPDANLSHFTSEDIWSLGVRGDFPLGSQPSGWIARLVDLVAGDSRGAVSVGVGRRRDFLGTTTDPLAVSQASSFAFIPVGGTAKNAFTVDTIRQILAQNTSAGASTFSRQAMDQAHALVDEVGAAAADPTPENANYSSDSPSRSIKDIARLIQADFPTCVYYTGFGGFDTHGDQGGASINGRHGGLMRRLDDAIGTFADDMKAINRWDDTVILVISEFGRKNFENGSSGTDHGHGAPVMVFGGGVNGGFYGSDITDTMINDLSYLVFDGVDFRDVYREVISGHLGVSASAIAQIFPETQDSTQTFGIV